MDILIPGLIVLACVFSACMVLYLSYDPPVKNVIKASLADGEKDDENILADVKTKLNRPEYTMLELNTHLRQLVDKKTLSVKNGGSPRAKYQLQVKE